MSHKISFIINNQTITIDINKIARQADGTALIRYGDTVLFVSATSKKEVKEPKPFLPLVVDYRENTYAAGKIPGGFFKREGRPSEKETLTCRMIDRPIRSLFPEGYFFDTHIVGYLLSADLEHDSDTLGIIGASVALNFSDIPFTTPIGAVKIGYLNEEFIINPPVSQLNECTLSMIVVGTEDGIVMLEAEGAEIDEEIALEAISKAREPIDTIIHAQKELLAELNIQKRAFTPKKIDQDKLLETEKKFAPLLIEAFQAGNKKSIDEKTREILNDLILEIPEENNEEIAETKEIFYQVQKNTARDLILNKNVRVDGRAFDEIRPISIDIGFLPRTHGSALFTRGETQSLATVTLGTFEDVQRIDTIGQEGEKRFMLHYNFPPFCVGEAGFLRGPGRRDIGHGALAEKSIRPTIPNSEEDFPYTIRVVSDIYESNGSSSMATVCSGVLALMDAGVPLTGIVAGMAMGLVTQEDQHAILTDIAGVEDHFGDMDLKVAGTEKGITSIQMDLKVANISMDILREGLLKAKKARLQVLAKMKEAIAEPRSELSPYAPRIVNIQVNPNKLGDVIGPAGKIIKKIVAETTAKIDIDDSGTITIASPDPEAVAKAIQMIKDITTEAELGKTYTGKVIRIEEYGVFIEILPNVVGLLHISEYAHHHIRNIRDEVSMGQTLEVKVIGIDENNKVKVSRKALEEGSSQSSNRNRDDRNRDNRDHTPSHYKKRSFRDNKDRKNRY
jgi:polyribonucleotide nucleotidyltransferase